MADVSLVISNPVHKIRSDDFLVNNGSYKPLSENSVRVQKDDRKVFVQKVDKRVLILR